MKFSINEILTKLACFIACCIYVLAAIGGTAYLFYDGHAIFGVANIVMAVLALPAVVAIFETLNQ